MLKISFYIYNQAHTIEVFESNLKHNQQFFSIAPYIEIGYN